MADRASDKLDKVAELFPREEVEAKKKKVTGEQFFGGDKRYMYCRLLVSIGIQ